MVSAQIDEYLAGQSPPQTSETLALLSHLRPVVWDGDHPITDYFISSSHNTYLVANQLWGSSSPAAYTDVLHGIEGRPPARCVEIDVWYSSKLGPVVTHGHTLTKSISFKDVCVAIGNAIDSPEDSPITVSLECHVEPPQQPELVEIMNSVWGDKLVKQPVHKSWKDKVSGLVDGMGGKVTPNDIKGKIFLMVEWYAAETNDLIKEDDSSDSSSDSSDSDFSDSEDTQELKDFRAKHKNCHTKIHPDLAALGVYANSIKPKGLWHTSVLESPLHALINVSENAIAKLLPDSAHHLISHSTSHLRRCYPRGTRVQSTNMDPLPIWRCGTQVAALNMQVWDQGMQLNSAMFEGTNGWVLKPPALRSGGILSHFTGEGSKEKEIGKFRLEVIGADDVPNPREVKNLATYFKVDLFTPAKNESYRSKTVDNHGGDPMWHEVVEWEYEEDHLCFIRVRIYQDRWGKDTQIASFTASLDRLEHGHHYWPLVDGKGIKVDSKMLVYFGQRKSARDNRREE